MIHRRLPGSVASTAHTTRPRGRRPGSLLLGARERRAVQKALLMQYRQLALALHPDKCGHKIAPDAMQALNEAYQRARGQLGC